MTKEVKKEAELSLNVAIVRENGKEIDVVDRDGKLKTFLMKKNNVANKDANEKRICFLTHDETKEKAFDGLLTPCFNEEGKHGDPEEVCFCGVEEAHIHAHYYDAKKCGSSKHDLISLAQITLMPKETCCSSEDCSNDGGSTTTPRLVRDYLPHECNSSQVAAALREIHSTENYFKKIQKLEQDDQILVLVQDKSTADIFIKHECNSCGGTDYHGKLDLIAKRSWVSEDDCGKSLTNIHFFELNRNFSSPDFISSFINLDSDRVSAACCNDHSYRTRFEFNPYLFESKGKHLSNAHNKNTAQFITKGRTELYVEKICCEKEVLEIRSILDPLPGVEDVKVNIQKKTVYMDHDFTIISARKAADTLRTHNLDTYIKKDADPNAAKANEVIMFSELYVGELFCKKEIPRIENILKNLAGVKTVKVIFKEKTVIVSHDSQLVTMEKLITVLNKKNLNAKRKNISTTEIYVGKLCCKKEIPQIEKTLKGLSGVRDIKIAIKNKTVTIIHDDNITSAEQAVEALNIENFNAKLNTRTTSTTELYVDKLYCKEEKLQIEAILKGLPGVTEVRVTVSDKTVSLTYDHTLVSIEQAIVALNNEELGAKLKQSSIKKQIPFISTTATPNKLDKSEIHVEKMCCASEIPQIESILEKLTGIKVIKSNPTTKTVYIHHIQALTSVDEAVDALNQEKFGAKLKKTTPFIPSSCHTNKIGRSELFVDKICCASEIPIVESILMSLPGIADIKINTTTKTVYLYHDFSLTSAKTAAATLTEEKFYAEIVRDASQAVRTATVGRTELFVDKICNVNEIPVIETIISNLPNIFEVKVSPTTQKVYIYHDYSITSARDIAHALNEKEFEAQIKIDAGGLLQSVTQSLYVESTLTLVGVFQLEILKAKIDKIFSSITKNLVNRHEVVLATRTIQFDHNPKLVKAKDIAEALEKELEQGSSVIVSTDGEVEGLWVNVLEDENIHEVHLEHARLSPCVALSGFFWILSLCSYFGGALYYLKYCGIISVLLGVDTIGSKAWRTLCRHQIDVNCLMFIAMIGAVALQDYSEAAAVSFLFSISDWLAAQATNRARKALSNIVNLRPERANIIDQVTRKTIIVNATSVPINSIIRVRTGDMVPCDGIVIEGNSQIDESSLTGESRPVNKIVGDAVSGGTINVGRTQLLINTTATSDDSAVSRLIRLVEEAQANQSETQQLINEIATYYTPFVISLAVSMMTIPWAFGREAGYLWMMNGLITLVVACPCALIISTPVTYVAGLTSAAQRGILIMGGTFLESIAKVGIICFDKTGTITKGAFSLLHLNVVSDYLTRKQVFEYLYLMESPSSHPLAAALITAARNEGVTEAPKSLSIKDHTLTPGEGVSAIINENSLVHVGNHRMMERIGALKQLPTSVMKTTRAWAEAGWTVGFLCLENEIVASYCVADPIRPEASKVLSSLHDMGIELLMLTGDNNGVAKVVGEQIGLSYEKNQIKSDLLPKEKYEIVRDNKDLAMKKRSGVVMMVGDGVNDAPALAAADLGVSMGSGSALAMETADITLIDSNLTKLEYAIKLGQRVKRTILENILFSIIAKLAVLALTIVGKATFWFAIASDVGAMLIVTLNGMKLLQERKRDISMLYDWKHTLSAVE